MRTRRSKVERAASIPPPPTPMGDPYLMARARSALIVYEGLPLADGGAHELGKRDPRAVWRKLADFLRDCAVIEHRSATVALQELGWSSTAGSRAVRAELSALLGTPRRSAVGWGAGRLRDSYWDADPARVGETLRVLAGLRPLPDVYRTPAVFLGYEARFALRDPGSEEPFPHQGGRSYGNQDLDGRGVAKLGESRLYARLSRRPTCNLVLSLPFSDVTDEVRGYVADIQRRLPFRLSPDHWTRWSLNEERTAYVPTDLRGLVDDDDRPMPGRRTRRMGDGRGPDAGSHDGATS